MSITGTLIVQMIVFAILVWFTMKFVWPPITAALDERAKKIAEGLSALQAAGLRPDYLEIRNAIDLQPVSERSTELVILAAAYLGKTRLIDNLLVDIHTSA